MDAIVHWGKRESYNPAWASRAELAARFIRPGSSVLDLGSGPSYALKRFLPSGCTYTPADRWKWDDAVVPVDLEKGEFPIGHFDYTVMLGLLTYLRDPPAVLRSAAASSDRLIVSFAHPRVWASLRRRERGGWINHYRAAEFRHLLAACGWRPLDERVHSARSRHKTVIYHAGRPPTVSS